MKTLVGKDEKATVPPSNLHPPTSTLHPPAGVGPRERPQFFTWNFEKKKILQILKGHFLVQKDWKKSWVIF